MLPEKSVTGRRDAAENHAVSIPPKNSNRSNESSCTRPNFGTALAWYRQAP